MVKASASGVEDPGFESRLRLDFSGSSHTSDLKIGTPVATLLGTWHYRVSVGTGRPGVSILWLGEVESWICNFYLSVAAHKIVCADLSLRYTSMLLGRQATNTAFFYTNPQPTPTLWGRSTAPHGHLMLGDKISHGKRFLLVCLHQGQPNPSHLAWCVQWQAIHPAAGNPYLLLNQVCCHLGRSFFFLK